SSIAEPRHPRSLTEGCDGGGGCIAQRPQRREGVPTALASQPAPPLSTVKKIRGCGCVREAGIPTGACKQIGRSYRRIRCADRGSREPSRKRLGHPASIPSRRDQRNASPGHSVPRRAFGGAMLTLLAGALFTGLGI